MIAHNPQNEEQQAHNRQYTVAANPAVVLALIDKVRDLEQKNLNEYPVAENDYATCQACLNFKLPKPVTKTDLENY